MLMFFVVGIMMFQQVGNHQSVHVCTCCNELIPDDVTDDDLTRLLLNI